MAQKIQLLDYGYLELIETWGSDERIIEAARMSTDGAFKGWGPMRQYRCPECKKLVVHGGDQTYLNESRPPECCHVGCKVPIVEESVAGDEKLLAYLWNNKHHTPFEMAGATFEVQAPIFVFREWHRHRVPFSYNELSARYTPLPDLNYVPSAERLLMGSDGKNKQAGTIKGAEVLTEENAKIFRAKLEQIYAQAQDLYEKALNAGVPKELARVHLPVGRYSRMRASANLRGWLNFLTLRMAPGAQYEIRMYANALGIIIAERFPRTWELFTEGQQ
jgi:thymidylate synthase (FAD)